MGPDICWFYQAGLTRKKGGTRKPFWLPLIWGGYRKLDPVVNQTEDLQGSPEAEGALLALVQPWKNCSIATQVSPQREALCCLVLLLPILWVVHSAALNPHLFSAEIER